MKMNISKVALALLSLCNSPATRSQTAASVDILANQLQREHAAILSAKTPQSKAAHTYLLNNAADRFAYALNQTGNRDGKFTFDWEAWKKSTTPEIQMANQYGASILWCEYDGEWTVSPQGYLDYLSELPEGRYAEAAWWRGKLGHTLNACLDAEGSKEETAGFVNDYEMFLAHFPHGKHETEARKLLKEFQSDFESYKQQEKQ